MLGKWKDIEVKEVLKATVFRYFQKRRQNADGTKEFTFDVLQCPNWVNVVATDTDGHFVMVKQFRHGTAEFSFEFPAGVIHSGEDPMLAGMRELREETGMTSNQWTYLGEMNVNPAFMTNKCYFYHAKNCIKTHDQELDPLEEIEVHAMSAKTLHTAIQNHSVNHSLVTCGLYLLEHHS
ncbi:NUDIX domain protein [Bacteriovorax sp. BSW11_IV]|uniref:NUDIX hydrolase n=1 Tax=Bacteriovorax sp. BSW11_IV TaxID=1353529 RepID=UPI00038A25FE|nr:NUDIX hydrolase [Bacteriovorax sp. BSW11_IV]EQC44993.1 NUDIX domain protein [Bacteriovorax sp. BSW11_IV]